MKFKKLSVVAVISILAMIMVTGCGGEKKDGGANEQGEGGETYKVAMEATFPPFDLTDKSGNVSGIDVDLMEAIAKDQGFKLEWKTMSFNGLIPALQSKNIDIVASGMWANEERGKQVDFSDVYYESGLMLAVEEKNNDVKSVADLKKDMKVGAQIGTSGADEADKLKKEGKIKEVKVYEGLDSAMADLQNGTINAVINDEPVTKVYIKEMPGKIKLVGEKLTKEGYGFAVQKGNKELLDKINKGLANLKANGEYDKILAKWVGK